MSPAREPRGRPRTDAADWRRSSRGIVQVRAAADRRSGSLLHGRLPARATQNQKTRLWKLPEPWTHRTRPPLFGKPHTTRFPTAPTGPLIGNQTVTHVPG